ncbi:MAG TPA: YaiO family outer membrane beta-barrel protein [Bacteroidales bacterium]
MKRKTGFLGAIFLFLLINHLFAQNPVNTDSLFRAAKAYAKANDYVRAEKLCTEILAAGENGDVRFYLGLLYSWDQKYDDARRELAKIHEARPTSEEVIIAMANNELWADNPQAALDILNKALIDNPDNEEFLYLKARALNNLKRYDEAIAALNQLLKINPKNEKAQSLLTSIKVAQMKNALMLDFMTDFFDNQDPWYLTYLQYNRKTSIGTVIGRVNYAQRFSTDDIQLEADAYPSTGKHNYLYLNAGISEARLFPKYRFGAEFYQSLPKSFEASLGFRYLRFSSSDVTIYTGSVGKYWGNYWFSFREFVTPSGKRASFTEIFQARRYFNDAENYIGLQYSHGSSPDDIHTYLANVDKLRLQSDRVRVTYNHRFKMFWVGAISGAYEREEDFPTLFRNRYTIDISLQRIF